MSNYSIFNSYDSSSQTHRILDMTYCLNISPILLHLFFSFPIRETHYQMYGCTPSLKTRSQLLLLHQKWMLLVLELTRLP